jgi:hypothetical protein
MKDETKANQEAMERYREDVRTIRQVLVSVDRQPLFENWVFYAWGIIIVLGAVVHFVIGRSLEWSPVQEFVRLWVPLIAVGLSLEVVGYVINVRRNSLPFWSREFVQVLSGLIGSSGVLVFLVLILFQAGVVTLVPTVLLLGNAVCFFLFGQHRSYAHMAYIGFVELAAAVLLHVLHPATAYAGLLCGLVAGVSLIIAGVFGGRAVHAV